MTQTVAVVFHAQTYKNDIIFTIMFKLKENIEFHRFFNDQTRNNDIMYLFFTLKHEKLISFKLKNKKYIHFICYLSILDYGYNHYHVSYH